VVVRAGTDTVTHLSVRSGTGTGTSTGTGTGTGTSMWGMLVRRGNAVVDGMCYSSGDP
jgi:hypothetical protein